MHCKAKEEVTLTAVQFTSRALLDAGGLGISKPNIPTLKAKWWHSVSSAKTLHRKAAFDKVELASKLILVKTFFFFPEAFKKKE